MNTTANQVFQRRDFAHKRAALYLRVSDKKQEKMYGFAFQERQNKVLAHQLGVTIEPNHIIKDAYTGMEFRERPALSQLREMAKRGEFDVVIMWKLDRLGRKGIQREIIREELKYSGVTILTTDPDEHADDDSPIGEIIRAIYGFKAEQERNDLILRTTSGKRERAMEGKLLGTGFPLYGYKWRSDNPREKDAYILNCDIIKVDEDGTEWTEVKVVRTIFELVDSGMALRAIAACLCKKGIPTRKGTIWNAQMVQRILQDRQHFLTSEKPLLACGYVVVLDEDAKPWTEASVARLICTMADTGINTQDIGAFLTKKKVPTGRETLWQPATIHQMLSHPFYTGEATMFKRQDTVKKPGYKQPLRVIRPEEEQIRMPPGVVPQIIDKALFERVQAKLQKNKRDAPRNNKNPHESLLRSGLVKCGYCKGNAHFRRHIDRYGPGKDWCFYTCNRGNSGRLGTCQGATVAAHTLDDAAWEKALEIIKHPTLVDKKLQAYRIEDPSSGERERIVNKIARIEQKQKVLRKRLTELDLDEDTEVWLSGQLRELATDKQSYEEELKSSENVHEKWKKIQERLDELHEFCRKMREHLNDPHFIPTYQQKRDACEFFGITAIIWKQGHKPHYEFTADPPSIVSLLSCGCSSAIS